MSEPFDLKNHIQYSEGSIVSKTIVDRKSGTLTLFAFDKNQGLSEHTAPFDAVIEVLDGEAEITLQAKPVTVSSGQMIIMPANIPHSLRAIERFKMLLIMVRS